METNEEIELLKRSIINLQVCINDLHDRITKIEKPENKDSAHYFYAKDTENGCWLVKCAKTQGSFSTALWRNEVIQKQKCPCCGLTVRRKD